MGQQAFHGGMGRRLRRAVGGATTRGVLLRRQLERIHPLRRPGLRPPRLRWRPLQHHIQPYELRRHVWLRLRLRHRCLDRHGSAPHACQRAPPRLHLPEGYHRGGWLHLFEDTCNQHIRYQLFDGPAADRLSFIELLRFNPYTVEGTVLVPAVGGRLRFAACDPVKKHHHVRLWEKVVGSDGALQWIRQARFKLPVPGVRLMGFVETPPSLILDTKDHGPICINMETREWNKLPKHNGPFDLLPIMSFYHPLLPGQAPRERDETSPSHDEDEAIGSSASRIRIFPDRC
ncbi:hypothetical protein GQ55_5G408200 [Panicum hallii var. hallii]|uniref:DUF1618 domain-containing protein n=1 Tax=Panicum hallii var. hallii TaxID=1504633 RepID=A0A2T7DNM3_9POAL|nr:hypothetical protein GQ55_5G408200 [Panicum hallii var. hallii]